MAGKKTAKKVAILLAILLMPSIIYLFLSTGDYNYRSLPYIGPQSEQNGEKVYHKIPDFSFVNQNGETITQEDFKGKIYVADFFFATCPSICPKMATHLYEVQKRMKDRADFAIISHTVNPEHDSVEVLKEYAKKVHANDEMWHFVTGAKEDLYNIAFDGYFASASRDSLAPGGFLHSANIFLIDREGHIRGTYDDIGNVVPAFDGTSTTEMKKLVDAINNLYLEEHVPAK